MTVVVAKHTEDVSWCHDLPNGTIRFIYDKSGASEPWWHHPLPNCGREANTYLCHIVRYYSRIQGDTVFCQGNPFEHAPDFLEEIQQPERKAYGQLLWCDRNGGPQVDWCPLHEFCKVLGLPVADRYHFSMGAQFRASAEQIRARPIEFYRAALALTALPHPNVSPWVFERLWSSIFGLGLCAS